MWWGWRQVLGEHRKMTYSQKYAHTLKDETLFLNARGFGLLFIAIFDGFRR